MKLAILNDTHCGIRNSSDIFLDNAEKFYSDIFFPYLLENSISHIVHLGDIFDNRKFINFRALHRHRKMFLNKLREYKITMDIIPGNHDTYYKNTNDLNSLKELLGHFTDVINIIMEPTVMNYDGLDFALIPWIAADNEQKTLEFLNNTSAQYVGGHFELNGFAMGKGTGEMTHGMDPVVLERFQGVYSGHYHTRSSKGHIHYLGSQMEFFWNDGHDPKFFHIFDTDTKDLTAIRNPNTLFHRIYYDDTKEDFLKYDFSQVENKFVKIVVINKTDLFTFDRFVDTIQGKKIHELKIAENFTEFVGENVEDGEVLLEDTTTLLDSYVDAVDTDLDKDRIKGQMHDLMIEAQTLEIA
jgi:DNA repair exonuclease SbcCD nuclease subunit